MKWVAHLEGQYPEFEISVVVEGSHGQNSWGWGGTDKIIILDEDGDWSRSEFNQARERAKLIADALNGAERG